MGFKCGIIGLPNVGKSTLFNALTQTSAAEAANYPFCTIDPNVGCVGVPDDRLQTLAHLAKSEKVIPTQVEFVDIAGLVKGASKGEGLGNQFLSHIRATDAVVHVLRCFEDENVMHVDGSVDPLRDLTTIETELMLADLESLDRRIERVAKKVAQLPEDAREEFALMKEAQALLSDGLSLRSAAGGAARFRALELLSSKPIVYVCNVAEAQATTGNTFTEQVQGYASAHGAEAVIVSASIESEVAGLDSLEERQAFLESLGLPEASLAKVIRAGYRLLDLLTFFTAGPAETRAWSVVRNSTAPDAAAEIHTDFKRGFICAATISYEDYVACGGELGAKNAGKLRLEGKDYIVQDGDVMHFRFNV